MSDGTIQGFEIKDDLVIFHRPKASIDNSELIFAKSLTSLETMANRFQPHRPKDAGEIRKAMTALKKMYKKNSLSLK